MFVFGTDSGQAARRRPLPGGLNSGHYRAPTVTGRQENRGSQLSRVGWLATIVVARGNCGTLWGHIDRVVVGNILLSKPDEKIAGFLWGLNRLSPKPRLDV